MIIKRLTLHNFGVYADTNTLSFTNDRPVTIIGGMNGRGKTTILNAILLALYGDNSFAYKDSVFNSYGQYLRSLTNQNDGTLTSFVELEIKLENKDEDTYIVKREWNSFGKRIKDNVEVKKNYQADAFLSNNWEMFIETLIPSALSQYFFFDGDNIAELAVSSSDKKMRESIKTLLGVNIVEQLESDVRRVERKANKTRTSRLDDNNSERLRLEMERHQEELLHVDDEIEKRKDELIKAQEKLEAQKHAYVSKGGNIVEERQKMLNTKNELIASLQHKKTVLIEFAGSPMPLAMVKDLLFSMNEGIKEERSRADLKTTARTLERINSLIPVSADEMKFAESLIKSINALIDKEKDEAFYDASEKLSFQVNMLLDGSLEAHKDKTETLLKDIRKTEKEINEIDRQLSVEIDEKQIHRIFREIKKTEQTIIELQEVIDRLERKRSEVNGQCIRATSEFNRAVERTLSSLEMIDDEERIEKYANNALAILAEYKIRLQKSKIANLAKTVSTCYRRLANKENMISRVVINHETLDFEYRDSNGKEVLKSSLSEGEKQMMIISILWALAICSKRKLPVIIDTPLARLDSSHRLSLIKTYFPNASEQTIVLSTDSEIVGEYYKELKPFVSDEYTLIYNDKTKSSSIQKGYFGEVQ